MALVVTRIQDLLEVEVENIPGDALVFVNRLMLVSINASRTVFILNGRHGWLKKGWPMAQHNHQQEITLYNGLSMHQTHYHLRWSAMHGGMVTSHGFPMNNLPTIEPVVVELACDAKHYHNNIKFLLATTAAPLVSPIVVFFLIMIVFITTIIAKVYIHLPSVLGISTF